VALPDRIERAFPAPAAQRVTVFAGTLGLAAAGWVVAGWRMSGMDIGVATRLAPFPAFLAWWVAMMAAMMLPGAVPALLRNVANTGRLRAVPTFVVEYLAVWTLVGVVAYAGYRPHGTVVAGVLAIAAGGYELTPVKRHLRRCGQAGSQSGLRFGLCCAGSGLGLTVLLLAVGMMSVVWMFAVAAVNLAQKLMPPKPGADIPIALTIAGLGVLLLFAPAWVLGGMPPM
jgi:predicted metal-binding membrane protein